MTSQGITLQDKIDALKKKKEQENKKNNEFEEETAVPNSDVKELIESIETTQQEQKAMFKLLRKDMKTLNENEEAIYKKVEKLETGMHDELMKKYEKALNKSISRLEKQFKEQENMMDKIFKLKAVSSITLYFLSTVLLALILARVAIYGIWQGLGLNMLLNMSEWYFQLLGVVLFFGIIAGSMLLVINGVENIRRNYF